MQANLAYDSKITQTEMDGWLLRRLAKPVEYYMDPANASDSFAGKPLYFLPNVDYPDINKAAEDGTWIRLFNNATQSAEAPYNGLPSPADPIGSDMLGKKICIGSPARQWGMGGSQNENISTYIFRLQMST